MPLTSSSSTSISTGMCSAGASIWSLRSANRSDGIAQPVHLHALDQAWHLGRAADNHRHHNCGGTVRGDALLEIKFRKHPWRYNKRDNPMHQRDCEDRGRQQCEGDPDGPRQLPGALCGKVERGQDERRDAGDEERRGIDWPRISEEPAPACSDRRWAVTDHGLYVPSAVPDQPVTYMVVWSGCALSACLGKDGLHHLRLRSGGTVGQL